MRHDYDTVNYIVNQLDMADWTTVKSIEDSIYVKFGLIVSDRTWRALVETYNEQYSEHLSDKYIARSNKGYMLTDERDVISKTCDKMHKTAIALLRSEWKTRKSIGQKMNARLNIDLREE